MNRLAAALLAVAPIVAFAQPATDGTVTIYSVPDARKKPYAPHKTPTGKNRKAPSAPRKPAAPKPPAIHDKQGNAIPTSPDAYDVSSAMKNRK